MNYIAILLCFLSITIPSPTSGPGTFADDSAETPSVASLDEAGLQSLAALFLDGKVFLEDSEIQFLIEKGYIPADYFESGHFADFMSPMSGINLPPIPFLDDLNDKNPEIPPNGPTSATSNDIPDNEIESIWGPALGKLRSSWLSVFILLIAVAALFAVVVYRRGLGVDNKKYK